jgi:DNA polymerase-3 subunit delta
MLYLLHGADEFTRSEELAKWKDKLGDPAVASLNTMTLDGRKLSLSGLIQTCDALPFIAKRRLVIVEGFWSRFEPRERGRAKDRREPRMSDADTALIRGFLEYLPRLPESTHLVFVENVSLTKASPAFAALGTDKKKAYIREFTIGRDLARWIEKRMRDKGGSIAPRAAQELARFVGDDLRQLDGELEKLLAHANFQRTVTASDVHSLVSSTQQGNIFALVDAIGLRQRERAMRYLHELLDAGATPPYVLSMIERQFRILLQVKALQAGGATLSQMQKALGIRHAFVIEKSLRQAQNFSMASLEAIYAHLATVEQRIKTGEIQDVLALDLLVVELSGE